VADRLGLNGTPEGEESQNMENKGVGCGGVLRWAPSAKTKGISGGGLVCPGKKGNQRDLE